MGLTTMLLLLISIYINIQYVGSTGNTAEFHSGVALIKYRPGQLHEVLQGRPRSFQVPVTTMPQNGPRLLPFPSFPTLYSLIKLLSVTVQFKLLIK